MIRKEHTGSSAIRQNTLFCFLVLVLVLSLCSFCKNLSHFYVIVQFFLITLKKKKRKRDGISQATHTRGIKFPVTVETKLASLFDWRAEERSVVVA